MKILVRLPNWLGDLVMSTGFLTLLRDTFPAAEITVIIKKGLESLADFLPGIDKYIVFDRQNYRGLRGLRAFCRAELDSSGYDLYFSLPDSFSAAWLGFCSKSKVRIGYRGNWRSLLLTKSLKKEQGRHRAEEYAFLLSPYTDKRLELTSVRLKNSAKESYNLLPILLFNINSVAISRRLPQAKALEFAEKIMQDFKIQLVFCGSTVEKEYVGSVTQKLQGSFWQDLSGSGSLTDLIEIINKADFVLTTDSGPAHLATALGKKSVVLFGAGNPHNTAPYSDRSMFISSRIEKCIPCVKNICRYGAEPKCLLSLTYQDLKIALVKSGVPLKKEMVDQDV